jgi:hypothetical protein
VHVALHKLYEALAAEGALRADTPVERARERAEALLPGALSAAASEVRGDVQARHPRLFEAHLDSVAASIRDFLRRDLVELLPRGVARIEPEQTLGARLELPGGAALDVEGRIDRILHRPEGALRVGDKTGRRFDQFTGGGATRAWMQVPLCRGHARRSNPRRAFRCASAAPSRRDRGAAREGAPPVAG